MLLFHRAIFTFCSFDFMCRVHPLHQPSCGCQCLILSLLRLSGGYSFVADAVRCCAAGVHVGSTTRHTRQVAG